MSAAYTLGVIVLLMIAFLLSSFFHTFIYTIVNVVTSGRGDTTAFLFLMYAFGIAVLWYAGDRIMEHKRKVSTSAYWALGTVAGAYVIKFIISCMVLARHHIPLLSHAVLHEGGMSASLQLLRENLLASGILSLHAAFLLSFLAGTVLVAMIAFFVSQVPHLATIPTNRRVMFYVLFVVSSFMILKSLFSGGSLSVEAVVGLIFLTLLALRESYKAQVTSVIGVVGYFMLLAVLFIGGYFQNESFYISNVLIAFGSITLLSTIYAFYAFGATRLSYLVLILASIPFLLQIYNRLSSFSYLYQQIDPQAGAYVMSYQPLQGENYTDIGTAGNINLYAFSPASTTRYIVNDILPMTQFDPSQLPITLPWNTCMPTGAPVVTNFKITSFKPLMHFEKRTPSYFMTALQGRIASGYQYDMSLVTRPCLVEHSSILVPEIISEQLPSFTVYDLREQED
ncbi:MAG: hypothetical protein JWO73_813 [Candidatus Taylorbacteria bacterium]|nr:hypothetical protein [Candidatus Taylorbacteria bacterium]